MRASSAKAKGRRAAQEAQILLLAAARELATDDIIVTPSGVPGEDLRLSPRARSIYPMAFEVKNQESLNIWKAFDQACTHARGTDHIPTLLFKRNRTELMICMRLREYLELHKEGENGKKESGGDSASSRFERGS